MAGVIQGLQTGYGLVRDMQQRDFQKQQYDDQQARQSALDQRYLEERDYNRNRQSALDAASIAQTTATTKGVGLNNEMTSKAMMEKDADAMWQGIVTSSIDPKTGQLHSNIPLNVAENFQGFLNKYGSLPKYNHLNYPDSAIEIGNGFANGSMPKLEHVQATYQGLANKSVGQPARGGGTIAKNVITGLIPTDDGVKIKMVTYRDDGSSYESFVNNGRNSLPGTGVMVIPWDKAFDDIQAKAKTATLAKHLQGVISQQQLANRKPSALNPKDALAAANDIQKNIGDLYESLNSEFGVTEEQKTRVLQQVQGLQAQYDQLVQQAGLPSGDQANSQKLKQDALALANGDEQLALEAISELNASRANGRNDSLQDIIAQLSKTQQSQSASGFTPQQTTQIAQNLRGLNLPDPNANNPFLANNRL